ncbi:MAG: MFS transporter [Peptococcaceae bacterium]|nr:MFS transporter [Peptococcaceae bacterium]
MGSTERQIGTDGDLPAGSGRRVRSRRRIIWIVLSVSYLIGYFHRVSPAVIVDKLFSQFNIEAAAVVGIMAAIYFYVYFLMQIPTGVLTDIFGPRKVVVWGMTVAALGTVWFGLAGSAAGLFAGRFLVGLGVSVIFVSVMRVYSTWFRPHEFGTVLGLTVSTGNLGGILAAAPLAALVDALGWRGSFVLVGLITMLMAGLSWLVVRDDPRDVVVSGRGREGTERTGAMSRQEMLTALAGIVRNRHLWLALAGSFSIYGPFMALVGVWGVPFLMQVYGLGRTEAASVMMAASVGVMVGCFSLGLISDRTGSRKKPFIAFALGNVLVWAALTWWNGGMPPLAAMPALYFFLGVFGNTGMLTPIMIREYNPPRFAGLASGLGNMGGFVGSAFMQPFFGFLLDRKWSGAVAGGVKFYSLDAYQYAFGICFVFGCLAVLAASLLRESLGGDSGEAGVKDPV